jgi:hypothetical protein
MRFYLSGALQQGNPFRAKMMADLRRTLRDNAALDIYERLKNFVPYLIVEDWPDQAIKDNVAEKLKEEVGPDKDMKRMADQISTILIECREALVKNEQAKQKVH